MIEVEKQNKLLQKISKTIFGDRAALQIVDPKNLKLLKENARYFKKETFKNLVENVRRDERLSSAPLCCREDDNLLVLSGNHRVKAAIEAGIETILVIVILEELTENDKLAIQLSHNALVGLDDPHMLSDLWNKIDDIKAKLYSGISSDIMNQIGKIKPVTFSTPAVYTKSLTFAFTDIEFERVEATLQELSEIKSSQIHLAPLSQFEEFFQAIQKTKKLKNIKNGSLALLALIEMAEAEREELCLSEQ